jgi:antitoxin ParD1/3/4
MATMNISLSDDLRAFVEERVADGGYMTSSEYIRDVLRRERDRARLRKMLSDGENSGVAEPADEAFFDELHAIATSPRNR